MDAKTKKAVIIGIVVAVVSPIIVDEIRRLRNSKKAKNIEANTDTSFSSWIGDEDFFGIANDKYINGNTHLRATPLYSNEGKRMGLKFRAYKPFVVSPAKKIKVVNG